MPDKTPEYATPDIDRAQILNGMISQRGMEQVAQSLNDLFVSG